MRTKGAYRFWRALPRTYPYLRPYRKLAVISILLTIVASIIALAEPWPLAIMIDSVLGKKSPPGFLEPIFGSDPNTYVLLVVAASFGFVLTIVGGGLSVLTDYLNTKLDQRMVLDLRSDLFEHCQRLSLTFHDSTLTGRLMSKINLQAKALGDIVLAFPPLIQSGLTLIGMLVIALLIDWQVALVSLVAVPFIYYAIGLYGTRIVPRVQKVMSLEMRSLSIVHEAMGMLRVIVSFGRESYEHRRFRSQAQTAVDERVKLTVRQNAFSLGVSAATAAGTGLVLGFGAWHVLQGKITVGELTVLISYIAAVYQPLEAISSTMGSLHEQLVYLNASLKLLDTPPEVREAPNAIDMGRARGHVAFENVNFAYKKRTETLKDVSFEAKPGQRVAIVGPTGAGKTTLVSLLVRFYNPKQGQILIDGVDTGQLTLQSLRNQISVVLQEPLLFSSTIAANIQYGSLDAEMDQIVAAAKAANAHDFISALPDGYETMVGERGAQLSGGERQRISIARAFIKDAPILIMDEPTSSIDSRTESVILDALDDLMVGRTSFLIAHRLATVRGADLILVINHGELVEQGTHEELIARNGLYRQLYEAQSLDRGRRKSFMKTKAPAEGVAIGSNGDHERTIESAIPNGQEHLHAARLSGDGEPVEDEAKMAGGQRTSENGHGHVKEPQKPPSQRSPAVKRLGISADEDLSCDLCGRMLLKGEPAILFLVPPGPGQKPADRERKHVCELCSPIAEDDGWKARMEAPRRRKRLLKAIRPGKQPDHPPKQPDDPAASSLPARSPKES